MENKHTIYSMDLTCSEAMLGITMAINLTLPYPNTTATATATANSFPKPHRNAHHVSNGEVVKAPTNPFKVRRTLSICGAMTEKESNSESAEQVTKKFGLEAGLWKIFTSKDDGKEKKKNDAKELLARYGGAYLATSISLSLVSFGVCYLLVNSGVDVQALLDKVGIHTNETGEKVGTFALAYAAHKAASPIRFPPTVALTPVVAGWFSKKNKDDPEEEKNQSSN